jgi:integrase
MTTTLRQLFVRLHNRYTRSAHVGDLNAFAQWLIDHGYNLDSARGLVRRAKRSLDVFDVPPDSVWGREQVEQAFRVRPGRPFTPARRAFGMFLQSVGRLAPPQEYGPHASILAAYRSYQSEVRGITPGVIDQHMAEVGHLLRRALPSGEPLTRLTAAKIERHIKHRSREVSRRSLRNYLGALRAFLRYCFDHRLIMIRLDTIDHPARFREELPPRALEWALIQKLLSSIKRDNPGGWRDFMVLHLMAHYGLRPGEVAGLTVESIDWTDRTLHVEQSKTRSRLTLPLMGETVDLLSRYLREGRCRGPRPELFSCLEAPHRPISRSTVAWIFKDRAREAGLPITDASPYALRHSFAMRLFARNVGIKAIGDLMGHHNLASTALYLRLQTDMLRDVALPVPSLAKHEGGVA